MKKIVFYVILFFVAMSCKKPELDNSSGPLNQSVFLKLDVQKVFANNNGNEAYIIGNTLGYVQYKAMDDFEIYPIIIPNNPVIAKTGSNFYLHNNISNGELATIDLSNGTEIRKLPNKPNVVCQFQKQLVQSKLNQNKRVDLFVVLPPNNDTLQLISNLIQPKILTNQYLDNVLFLFNRDSLLRISGDLNGQIEIDRILLDKRASFEEGNSQFAFDPLGRFFVFGNNLELHDINGKFIHAFINDARNRIVEHISFNTNGNKLLVCWKDENEIFVYDIQKLNVDGKVKVQDFPKFLIGFDESFIILSNRGANYTSNFSLTERFYP